MATKLSESTVQVTGLLASEVAAVEQLVDQLTNDLNINQRYALGHLLRKPAWTDPAWKARHR